VLAPAPLTTRRTDICPHVFNGRLAVVVKNSPP